MVTYEKFSPGCTFCPRHLYYRLRYETTNRIVFGFAV